MTFTTDTLITALRARYDHYSAQSMLELARERAGIAEKPAFDAAEVRALRTALLGVGDRLDAVVARIDQLLAETPAPAPVKAAVEPAPVPAPATAETTIVLTGVEIEDDEQLLVCGGLAELGDWQPDRARPLTREGDAWLTTVAVTPGTEVEFKFLRRTATGDVIWERGANRTLDAKPRVDATWQ